jgi:chromate reductase, NAD(P)H dehydrogenase (quinone)
MAKLIGIAGSLRKGSFNAALLRAAASLAPAGSSLEIASIHGIPLYDGDVEVESGVPQLVSELKDRIAAADGLVIATPEYNNSIPGVLKNAIDWLTRPPKDIRRVWHGLPVGIIGATPGRGGTRLAQIAFGQVLRTLSAEPWYGELVHAAGAGDLFDDQLTLTDEDMRESVRDFMEGFVAFVDVAKRRPAPTVVAG